jgi:hypothetical protein
MTATTQNGIHIGLDFDEDFIPFSSVSILFLFDIGSKSPND